MDNEGDTIVVDLDQSVDGQPSNINISDVFEAISIADPTYGPPVEADAMFRAAQAPAPALSPAEAKPFVRIVEQPASKALRFRYECEGRSAGSIPGASSTPEKKTFPAIEICGHKGRCIVVVSCVTKDKPYRPHPHNLVGRELCRKGVCTVNVGADSPVVTFSNLGIQCVKRRDIEEALRVREEMRVDPFKTGFTHKSQPQSIDLNAVRLCFQVFLPDERTGKIRHALPPVVSDVIYDKKAMSDLVITRLSHCSASVDGGKQIILLCEKVAREDIAVTFFERAGDAVGWQADAKDVFVHKQVAICCTTPRYRDASSPHHVQAFIQLRRPSDNATSEPLAFELLPLSAGTKRKLPVDLGFLTLLLDAKRPAIDTNNNDPDSPGDSADPSADPSDDPSEDSGSALLASNDTRDDGSEGETLVVDDVTRDNERSLNELLDQVAELDEIYSESRARLAHVPALADDPEDFNDAGTYTSLQLAFRNPVDIAEPLAHEDALTYRGPIIEFSPLKPDADDAPPLPPKRVRKAPSVASFKTSQTSVNSLLKPGRPLPLTRNTDCLKDREASVARSEPALPPTPKKRSFFSRLFRRRGKSPAPSVKSEGKEKRSQPVGRSVSSVSGQRPSRFKSAVSHASLKDNASGTGLSYADSITHISLHADENEKSASQMSLRRPASLAPMPPTDGDTILVAESVLALDATTFKKLQDDLDLTDAEHYALYMAVAPHATISEFDETSCYYSPVDGNTHDLKRKRQKPLSDFSRFVPRPDHDMNQQLQPDFYLPMREQNIKLEPRDKTPLSSPPLGYRSPHYEPELALGLHHTDYQWGMQPNYTGAGPSRLGTFTPQEMTWPNMPHGMGPSVSPNLQAMSPNLQGHVSPSMGHVSPNIGHASPSMGHASPSMGHMSPNVGHVSPNLVQQHHNLQQLQQSTMMETTSDPPSITGLLMDRGGPMPQLNSGELSGLSSLLDERGPDALSDSLNRLSTGDLLRHVDHLNH